MVIATNRRAGVSLLECIVAATVLTTVLSVVTSVVFRVGRLWTDTAHQRLAIQEVSNQLEILSQLSPTELSAALEDLQVSSAIRQSLYDAKLVGVVKQDEFGDRVELELTYPAGRPVRLTAWLDVQTAAREAR